MKEVEALGDWDYGVRCWVEGANSWSDLAAVGVLGCREDLCCWGSECRVHDFGLCGLKP